MADHTVSIIATRTADDEPAYRALCSCRWKGQRYPLDRYALAEEQARQHTDYHDHAARIAGTEGA